MLPTKNFLYSLNQKIRHVTKRVMRSLTNKSKEVRLDFRKEPIRKILLVRATFRMGHSIIVIPAITVFREMFPNARIDFAGAPISRTFFRHLPIDHHFCITRRFPHSSWAYLTLVKKLRSVDYDLAVDLSCSQSAMGAFIVGFSGARFRVGLQGEWDHWFNVRISRPPERNKYKILSAFLKALGLRSIEAFPSLVLSSGEKKEGGRKIREVITWSRAPIVGVFVGGRTAWAKRWPIENFCQLITSLHWHGINVVTFFGPEEKSLIGFFKDALELGSSLVFEASPRAFAAMVSNCDLFVTCDSGPMHLACALGTRTVAIFQHPNFDHWGPPSSVARVVYHAGGCSAEQVLDACFRELGRASANDAPRQTLPNSLNQNFARVGQVLRRLDLSLFAQRLFSISRCAQTLCFAILAIYAYLFPPSGIFEDGTWVEAFTDTVGIAGLLLGVSLRIWAASHLGTWTGPQRLKAPTLVVRGPYAYVRHPIYIANFGIALGLMFLLEAFPLFPLLLAMVVFQFFVVVPAEESFLKEKLGDGYDLYCRLVPACIPKIVPDFQTISFGKYLVLKELGGVCGILVGAFFLEWIEAPMHRLWIVGLWYWLEAFVR